MVSDHDELAIPTPRPDALCKRFVQRMDPWWGYVVAGALLALGGAIVGVLALITAMPALGIKEKTLAAQVCAIVALVLGEVLAYVIFTRWRRLRMGRKRTLIRDGTLTTATVGKRSMAIDKGRTTIDLDLAGGPSARCAFNLWFAPSAGAEVRILWLALGDNPHVLAFDGAGRMYSGHIKSLARR
jgi:hypothetical protein